MTAKTHERTYRRRTYKGFGTALEEYSPTTHKWYHVRWIDGPSFWAQRNN